MSDRERYEHLRRGLVGPERDLYLNNADFKAVVDSLAMWLPELVGLLADGARWRHRERAEALNDAMRGLTAEEAAANLTANVKAMLGEVRDTGDTT